MNSLLCSALETHLLSTMSDSSQGRWVNKYTHSINSRKRAACYLYLQSPGELSLLHCAL